MRLVSETSPLPRLLVFPLLVLAIAAWLLLQVRPELVLRLAHCPWRDVTGLACPTCGGTHAATELAAGRIGTAFAANPLVASAALAFAAWAVWAVAATLIPVLRRQPVLGPREKRAARFLAALLLIAAWVWQVRILS